MLSKIIENALNEQVGMEAAASQQYLAMACWCETKALAGCAQFLYGHSDEERMHMLKLVHYINDAGGTVKIPSISQPKSEFDSILNLFESAYQNELEVSASIDNLIEVALQEKDKQTANFLQWYLTEQHEEETLYRGLLDKVKLIGLEGRGPYFIDKEVEELAQVHEAE